MIRFGTDGWRDIIADGFTYDNLRLVSRGIARYLNAKTKEPRIVVGYDNRFMGFDFANVVAAEMAGSGIRTVIGQEAFPTPVVAYAVLAHKTDGAIMLTASHNPYYYNGLKFIPEYAGPATGDITAAIEKAIIEVAEETSPAGYDEAMVETVDFSPEYMRHALEYLDVERIRKKLFNVGLDPYYGAGLRMLPELAEAVGLRSTVLHGKSDPLFGGTLPDPSEKNLAELTALVLAKKLDAGLALDGDADRFGIIADDGGYLSANQISALLLLHMVKNRNAAGVAVRTVATTHLIDAIADDLGITVIETPVGFKHIGELMRKRAVVIGGEESGGLSVLGHIPEKDGLLANMLVMEMIAVEDKPLSAIWAEVTAKYGRFYNERLDIHLPAGEKEERLAGLKNQPPEKIGDLEVLSVDTVDGVRLNLSDDAWLLIRPSGTEPLVRAYVETVSETNMKSVTTAARDLLGQ
jgi:phosphomannomutase